MTDAELDRLIALAESGDITEEEADRLDVETNFRAAVMMSNPKYLDEIFKAGVFVDPPEVIPIRREK